MKLKEFKINHGGKFNADTTGPVVLLFETKKTVLEGDQGAGKSTVLDLFAVAAGRLGGDKVMEALKNRKSGKIDLDLTFTGNDRAEYTVRVTNSQFIVHRNGDKQDSPKELLRKVLGVGSSLLDKKNEPIEEIVKSLATYSVRGAEEFHKEMLKLKDGMKKAKDTRAKANTSANGIREQLRSEGYMEGKELVEKKWTASETKFSKKPDIKKLSEELTAAGTKSDKYIQNETKVKQQEQRKAQIEDQIAALRAELKTVEGNIEVGRKWLETNKGAKKEYDAVKEQYDNAAQEMVQYDRWQQIKAKKDELDQFEDIAQRADAQEKDLVKKQQELQWEVIPDIRGLEIVLEDSHEDEGEQKKAGFYYNGLTSRQLSASEWLGVVARILKKNKVPVLLVDDASTLGSGFMEILDELVKAGTYVLMAEMKRGTTELTVEYQ